MPFCFFCGAENPDGARFCAKCGNQLVAAAASESTAPVQPTPPSVPPRAPVILQTPSPPQASPETLQVLGTAKEVLRPAKIKPPTSPREPVPGAPGQTQFFMAAAGVSRGAKVKRVIFFVIGALVIGTLLFLMIRYSLQLQEKSKEELLKEKKASQAITLPETEVETETKAPTGEPGATAGGETAKKEGKTDEGALTEETKPALEEMKKKEKKKNRTR